MEEAELQNTAPEYDPKPCPLCGRIYRLKARQNRRKKEGKEVLP